MSSGQVDEESNTAYKAAVLFAEYTETGGAEITIEKRIPSLAGLGGSSADAAAVLFGMDRLYGTKLGKETLSSLGRRIGADVPFSLFGGTARARGIGEKLEALKLKKPLWFTVVKPHQGVSTAEAFKAYTKSSHISIETVAFALQKGDIDMFRRYSDNSLGIAALKIAPDIMKAAAALGAYGKAFMSGSGSSMFCVFETKEDAEEAVRNIKADFELCGAFSCTDCGVEIIGENL
jgi:4-diphosphocytidyl-2-C-methyl-D-erythritol kinase